MAYNHALRGKTPDLHAEYEPNDGNLSASGGSMFVSFWVRKSAGGLAACPIYIEGNNSFFLYCYRSGSDWVLVGPGAASGTWTGAVTYLGDGEWHHIIMEADRSGGAGNGVIRVWADGDVKAQKTGLTWTAPTVFSEFHVGGDKNTPGIAQLDIDDVAVFAGYSTEAERDAAYNAGDGIKGLDSDDFANATRTFYASYDQNSATADAANGTAAPIAGRYSFIDGFWFGQATGFETTTLGPSALHWCTNGETLYDPDRGGVWGYEHWSARLGVYGEPEDGAGRFRVTADANGALELRHELLRASIPMYLHIRFRTSGLQGTEALTLRMTCPDSRGAGTRRTWACTIQNDQIQGQDANNVVTVDTEAWVDLKVSAWCEQIANYNVKAHAVVNDEHELRMAVANTDPSTAEIVNTSVLLIAGSALTGTPYVEIASLGVHCHMPPAAKQSAIDTFPDEDHLVATSNAGRQTYDGTTECPMTLVGTIWQPSVGTWANSALTYPAPLLDVVNDKLLIWSGATHNVTPWPALENGMYKYNIGFGEVDLTNWPGLTTGDTTQGSGVYRPGTPYLYPHLPGVIDCHDGRRMLVCTRYHLPDSANFVGQCRGDVVVGELTANETFVPSNDGRPVLTPRLAPSYCDTQLSAGNPTYWPNGLRNMRYVFWGQCYGDRNTWGGGGSAMALRGLYLAHGETLEALSVWPVSGAALPMWSPPEHFAGLCRADDDFFGLMTLSAGTKYVFVCRSRVPMLLHPPERLDTYRTPTSCIPVFDEARGIFHIVCGGVGGTSVAYDYMRQDGWDWIGIDSGQATGNVTTVTINKPSSGWGSLRVNVDAYETGGKIEVAVLDPSDGSEIAGYGQADCTDITTDDTDHEVTWGSAKLSSLTAATYRLKFYFTRADSGDATPRLYSYRVADWPSTGGTQATKMACSQDLIL